MQMSTHIRMDRWCISSLPGGDKQMSCKAFDKLVVRKLIFRLLQHLKLLMSISIHASLLQRAVETKAHFSRRNDRYRRQYDPCIYDRYAILRLPINCK